mmetsp:Transcript_10802/g.19558  ORF Transcript_10802/g.19558 Transcript_10802/m.19558 type:complete len:1083 (-) Transcript_10802:860-4108(-)
MHIKQITISNFRSFKQQPEIHPFSPGTNAIVGRNGSGKSNLFDAMQFVLLSPRFQTLRSEERQALLHEGSGHTAVNAFVEIVFDNSDNRFSVEHSDEVVLRRTVGHKKDEFFLQRKRATKAEIQSLLEGAGFSKSNPYYIVQQGKVSALCTMSDGERLALLKEVAGTTVYDEKKAESLAKMEENKTSIFKIHEILSYIEERLEELRGEKEELTQYQELDRERRAMEYTLYDKELRKARLTLDEIESNRSEKVNATCTLHEEARNTHNAIRNLESSMKAKTSALRRNKITLQDLETDKTEIMTRRTKLELECKELEECVASLEEIRKSNELEIQKLDAEITKAQDELTKVVQPEYDSAVEVLTRMTNERDEAKKKMDGLYAKQGRGRQFSSKKDRDQYLRSSIKDLEAVKTDKENALAEQRDALSNLRRTVSSETKDLEQKQSSISKKTGMLQSLNKSIAEKKRQRIELIDARKEQWRKTEELAEKLKDARENSARALSDVRKVMPRATAMGIESLTRIVQEEGIVVGEQYLGMLMDNFELKASKFQTAVEVAAQNSLFHVIVDTDETAARLMNRLEKDKLGRVTFLPLNRLRVDNEEYPDSPDVQPLLRQCIQYDAKVDKAMKQVFGKKLLARSVEAASIWSAKSKMDAITLDGDLCSRKGALTGGYVDLSKSRLRAHRQEAAAKEALAKAESAHQEINRKAQATDQSCTNLIGELQRMEAKQADFNHTISENETEIDRLQNRLENQKKQIEKIEKTSIPLLEHEISSVESEIGRLTEEMGTDLTSTLSDEDREMLANLKKIQTELTTEVENQNEVVAKLSVDRQKLQSLLEDNLLKRRTELVNEGATGEGDESRRRSRGADAQQQRKEDLEQLKHELDDATRISDDIESRLAEAKKVNSELRAELSASKSDLEGLKSKDMKNAAELEKAHEEAERLLNKRSMSVSKRELYMRKIQELGSLPPPASLEKFRPLTISALMRELEKVNKKLKKYSHVNKKAYDQYVNFSEQRESLLKRVEELDNGAAKVKELVESLDRQKDEAINRTFRGVSAHFKDVSDVWMIFASTLLPVYSPFVVSSYYGV